MNTLGIVVVALTSVVLQVTVNGKVGLREATTLSVRQAPANVQPCAREALKIKEGETDAAMGGVRRTPYVLTNISQSPCTLQGYPSLELLNNAGAVIKRATKEKTDEPITAATLEPGKTAWFALNFNAGGAGYMGKPCPTYRQLRITMPGAKRPFVLKTEIQTCARSDFDVTPVVAGTPE
ncbi:MAG TPA: DUF4232 domain-containing protein [Pyrinomonadaceae bacterium]|jgi:hypothetical protein|nr:DUF4232 domain-containing protein [Pyrinomonadaceae bacterium]